MFIGLIRLYHTNMEQDQSEQPAFYDQMITYVRMKCKHIFGKYVRKNAKIVLTFENVFDIIRSYRTGVRETDTGGMNMKSAYYGEYDYMHRAQDRRLERTKRARIRQVRRQKIVIIAIGVLITMALCSFFTIKTFANTDNTAVDSFGTKQYRSVMIYCGDTVESIAKDNYCFEYHSIDRMASEICSINNISEDESLIPGNYLVIPYYNN